MKKSLIGLLALVLCLFCVTAFAETRIYTLKGPTGIGMAGMMDSDDRTFTLCGSPDEIVSALASGNADIAACPTNLAAVLNKKTNGNVQMLALNTLGVLHVVTSDPSIQSIQDLAGRTVYATGQASVPEYVLSYILEANGLADSVTVEYVGEHSELAALLAAGKADIGILPEPHVTSALMKNDQLRASLDVTELFEAASGTALTMGCVVVRRDFAESNPEAVAAFMDDYEQSVAFVNGDPHAAAQQVEAFGIMPKAAAAERAIPNCHIVFIEGDAMRAQVEPFFQLLLDANPASIGGALPDDDFYYVR